MTLELSEDTVVERASQRPPLPSGVAPDLLDFAAVVASERTRPRVVERLYDLLTSLDAASASHESRLDWMEELSEWMRASPRIPVGDARDAERTARLTLFVRALAKVPYFREGFADLFTRTLAQLKGTRLFADMGIPVEPGFWREAVDRISKQVLPVPRQPNGFADFVARLFENEDEAAWLDVSPRSAWAELWTMLERSNTPVSNAWPQLSASMVDAVRILTARIAALGVASDIRERMPETEVGDLPFLRLPRIWDAIQSEKGKQRDSATFEGALGTIEECREAVRLVQHHVEEFGVSVDLVYRLELISEQLTRLEQLLRLLMPQPTSSLGATFGQFARDIVQAQFQSRSVVNLLRTNAHLLAKKVVERAGKTGEHYITETRAEWRKMLVSAGGGGFLTTFTAALKFLLPSAPPVPDLWIATFACANYAGSFLLMAALGFTLATKQPSMTAAALAASLESREGELPDPDWLVTLVAKVARSQLAAAIGNIGMVIPTAIAFGLLWSKLFGKPLLGAEKAQSVIQSLQPFSSGTIWYAAFTGVLLWVSSIVAGWLENWVTYRRLPEALAQHRRIRRVFGADFARRLGASVSNNAASFGGSVALGVMLGVVPLLGKFTGLPLDARHVTLSTGSLVFAGQAVPVEALVGSQYLLAMLGIAIIGALNFGVSFVLALAVALRARDAFKTESQAILQAAAKALARRVYERPLEFMFPPRPKPGEVEVAKAHH